MGDAVETGSGGWGDSPTDGLAARSGLGGGGDSTAAAGLSDRLDGESASCCFSNVRRRTARGAGGGGGGGDKGLATNRGLADGSGGRVDDGGGVVAIASLCTISRDVHISRCSLARWSFRCRSPLPLFLTRSQSCQYRNELYALTVSHVFSNFQ